MKYNILAITGMRKLNEAVPSEFKLMPDHFHNINELLRQLSSNPAQCKRRITLTSMTNFLKNKGVIVLAMWSRRIVGMGYLVPVHAVDATTGRIEDIIVAERHRQRGISKKIMGELIQSARLCEYSRLDLTSRPERIPANHLYVELGFKKIETNVYRLYLAKK